MGDRGARGPIVRGPKGQPGPPGLPGEYIFYLCMTIIMHNYTLQKLNNLKIK